VGTEKRERQKANKAMHQQQLAQTEGRKKNIRIGALVVGGIVAVIALVWVASALTTDDSEEQPAVTTVLEQPPITTPETTDADTTGG
jgi:predicted Kef-type K+ transport protein